MYKAPDKRFRLPLFSEHDCILFMKRISLNIYIYVLRPDQINLLLLGFAGRILRPVEKKLYWVKV